MAEKQNSSEMKISTSAARRRANLPSLSRIIKSQTSSFQRRAANTKPVKAASRSGFTRFLMKVAVGAGAVYFSALLGVWGEPDDSAKFAQRVKTLLTNVDHQKFIPEELREKFTQTTTYIKNQIEFFPEEAKTYYEKTEKYVIDFIKGNKD